MSDSGESDIEYATYNAPQYADFTDPQTRSLCYQALKKSLGIPKDDYHEIVDRDEICDFAYYFANHPYRFESVIFVGQVYYYENVEYLPIGFRGEDDIWVKYWVGYPINMDFLKSNTEKFRDRLYGCRPRWTEQTIEITIPYAVYAKSRCGLLDIGELGWFKLTYAEYDRKSNYLKAECSEVRPYIPRD